MEGLGQQRLVVLQQFPDAAVQRHGARLLVEHQEPVAEFEHRPRQFLAGRPVAPLHDVDDLDERPLALGEAVDRGVVRRAVLEPGVGTEARPRGTAFVEGRKALAAIGGGHAAQGADVRRMVVVEAFLRDFGGMFVELPRREDVVAGHVPVGQREQPRQQRRTAAAMAAQQHGVGVFVARVRRSEVAAVGQQARLAVHHGDLVRVMQAVIHPGDVQCAVVGPEGAFDVADAGQRVAEQRERTHQLLRIAVGAALDGLDGRFDQDDGFQMLGNGDALLGRLQRALVRRIGLRRSFQRWRSNAA